MWARQRDRTGALAFIPYQEAPSPPMTDALRTACASSVHVITRRGRVLRGGKAATFVLGRCGHPRLATLLSLPGIGLVVEGGYRVVARYRGAIWSSRAGRAAVERLFRVT